MRKFWDTLRRKKPGRAADDEATAVIGQNQPHQSSVRQPLRNFISVFAVKDHSTGNNTNGESSNTRVSEREDSVTVAGRPAPQPSENSQADFVDTATSRPTVPNHYSTPAETADSEVEQAINVTEGPSNVVPHPEGDISSSLQPSITSAQNTDGGQVQNQTQTESTASRKSCFELAIESLCLSDQHFREKITKLRLENTDELSDEALIKSIRGQAEKLKDSQTRTKNVIETTIRYTLLFKGLVNVATVFDPSKASRVAGNALFGILEAILDATVLEQQKIRDVSIVASELAKWANVEKLYLTTAQPTRGSELEALESSITNLYISFFKLDVDVIPKKGKNLARYVAPMAPVDVPSWSKLMSNFNVAKGECDNHFTSLKLNIGIRKDILEWLSDIDPLVAYEGMLQRTHIADRYQQCGGWLLDTRIFKEWASSEFSEDYSILWLRGTVGTGKSTLLTRVVQWHLERSSKFPDHRFAYAYCSRGQGLDTKSSYIAILKSILRQASFDQLKGEIPNNILGLYNERSASGKATPLTLVSDITDHLSKVLQAGVRLRVMIDALDECDHPIDLMKSLRKVWENAPGELEILVTSRHEVPVNEEYCQWIDLNTSDNNSDMKNFIKAEVRREDKSERLLEGEDENLEDRVIAVLNDKAGGLFRWAQLQISLILDLHNRQDIEEKLESLKKGLVSDDAVEKLNMAYADIFSRNTPKGKNERKHATKLYRILLACQEKLKIDELAKAIDFRDDKDVFETDQKLLFDGVATRNYVLGLCRDFVIETSSGTADFAHISVKDYLQGIGKSSLPNDEYSDFQCNIQMAQFCLTYLIGVRGVSKPDKRSTGLFGYAFWFWGQHCAKLNKSERQKSEILDILVKWMIDGKGRTPFNKYITLLEIQVEAGHERFHSKGRSQIDCLSDNSALFTACVWNLEEIALLVLQRDAPQCIELRNYMNSTPLFVTCAWQRKETVKILLEFNPKADKIGSTNILGHTSYPRSSALHASEDSEISEILLIKYPDLLDSIDKAGETPLFRVAENTNPSAKKLAVFMLSKGANPKALNFGGETPLHTAAQKGNLEVIKAFNLEELIHIQDKYGMTPLLCAVKRGAFRNRATINYLLERGACILDKNNEGRGVLHYARSKEDISYLTGDFIWAVSKKELLLVKDTRDNSRLIVNAKDLKQVLLEAKDDIGNTPLLNSAPDIWELDKLIVLVLNGAQVRAKNKMSQNCLHLIMSAKNFTIYMDEDREGPIATAVRVLTSRGCDINAKDDHGKQPIHHLFAFKTSPKDMIYAKLKLACLAKEGVSIFSPDNDGKNLIDYFWQHLKHQVELYTTKLEGSDSLDAKIDDVTFEEFRFLVSKFVAFLEHCIRVQRDPISQPVDETALKSIKHVVEQMNKSLPLENNLPPRFAEHIKHWSGGEIKLMLFSYSDSLELPKYWYELEADDRGV